MSLLTTLEADGQKLETFIGNLLTGAKKVESIFKEVSTPTKTIVVSLINDVITSVADATAVAGAASAGAIPAAITLSVTTVGAIKQLITDAKAGEAIAVADLAAFGIKL